MKAGDKVEILVVYTTWDRDRATREVKEFWAPTIVLSVIKHSFIYRLEGVLRSAAFNHENSTWRHIQEDKAS